MSNKWPIGDWYPWELVPEQYGHDDYEVYDEEEEEDNYIIPANYYVYGSVWKQLGLDILTGIDENGDEI